MDKEVNVVGVEATGRLMISSTWETPSVPSEDANLFATTCGATRGATRTTAKRLARESQKGMIERKFTYPVRLKDRIGLCNGEGNGVLDGWIAKRKSELLRVGLEVDFRRNLEHS